MIQGNLTLGIKYCGHCNPKIDTEKIVQIIKARLGTKVLRYDHEDVDVLVILNACPTACAEIPAQNKPVVIIGGEILNSMGTDCDEIAQYVLEILDKEHCV